MIKQIKPKKCVNCRELFTQANSLIRACSMACALDYGKSVVKVKKVKAVKEFNKETAAMKRDQQKNDSKFQHKQCKKVFNLLRKLQELKWFKDRGLEPVCISCGLPKGGDIWANGHYKQYGNSIFLRYDPNNSYLQHNKRCNSALAGNISGTATTHGYKQGLINRFGKDEAIRIMDYCDRLAKSPERFSCEDLESMRKDWNKEIRELEKYLNV